MVIAENEKKIVNECDLEHSYDDNVAFGFMFFFCFVKTEFWIQKCVTLIGESLAVYCYILSSISMHSQELGVKEVSDLIYFLICDLVNSC